MWNHHRQSNIFIQVFCLIFGKNYVFLFYFQCTLTIFHSPIRHSLQTGTWVLHFLCCDWDNVNSNSHRITSSLTLHLRKEPLASYRKKETDEINEGNDNGCLCIYYIYISIKYMKFAWDITLQSESIDCEMSSLKMSLVCVLKKNTPLHNELLWL